MTDQATSPLTDAQLDEVEACVTGPLGTATVFDHTTVGPLVAEVRRLRAELADLQAENAKLIRWHGEDDKSLNRMRNTIVRLRTELAEAGAAVAAAETGE